MYVLKTIKSAITLKIMMVLMLVLFSFLLVACNFNTKVKATFTGTIETIEEDGNGGGEREY